MNSIPLYLLCSLALCAFGSLVSAQELSLEDSIPVQGDQLVVDRMGYLYGIENDHVIKYSPQGDSMFLYSNKLLGEIDQLDVTLALRPLLFYQNSNQIIVTDNTLSEQLDQTISLETLNWQQVTRVASSFNNNKVWLYDQSNFELLLVDRQLNIEQRSGNLLQIINTDSIEARHIKEYRSKVYFNNPKKGIHVFDLFGTYYNTLHLTGVEEFELFSNYVISVRQDSLSFYNTPTFTERKVPIPLTGFDSIALKNDMVYILKSGMVFRFKILPGE